ncbi:MAG: dihydrofolate reductase family protein [Microthrixaceae bacterium]|nr:dihydrofolate reductase family protein [Microthrixaceae bacterium]
MTIWRTLIVTAFISVDGVMEAPGGEDGYRNAGWTFTDIAFLPEAYAIKGREQEEATALLLGRRSYEAFARCGLRWRTSPVTTRCPATWFPPRSPRVFRDGRQRC